MGLKSDFVLTLVIKGSPQLICINRKQLCNVPCRGQGVVDFLAMSAFTMIFTKSQIKLTSEILKFPRNNHSFMK